MKIMGTIRRHSEYQTNEHDEFLVAMTRKEIAHLAGYGRYDNEPKEGLVAALRKLAEFSVRGTRDKDRKDARALLSRIDADTKTGEKV